MASITGVYEHILATSSWEESLRYWAELGFFPVEEGSLRAEASAKLYGIPHPMKSCRLRCGELDTHGLLRLVCWEGYSLRELPWTAKCLSPGNRWVTQRTDDIFQLTYTYDDDAKHGGDWLVSDLVRNYLGATGVGENFYNRYKGVYEVMVLGRESRQVFFQRAGYQVEGYGDIPANSPLGCSEFTHGGIVVRDLEHLAFYTDVLGLINEGKTLQGTPRKMGQDAGPLMNSIGEGYNAHTIVSPNQKTGRIYYAMPTTDYSTLTEASKQVMDVLKPATSTPNGRIDTLEQCRPGVRGLFSASYKAKEVSALYEHVNASAATSVSDLLLNEFGESEFTFIAPDLVFWNILSW